MRALGIAVTAMVAAMTISLTSGQANRCFPGETLEFFSAEFPSGVERFGLGLFRQLAADLPGNLFVSPYSIWSALALAYFGSEGNTKRELEAALNLRSKTHTFYNRGSLETVLITKASKTKDNTTSGAIFKSMNKAYVSDQLVIKKCIANLLVDIRYTDFLDANRAVATINADVSNATEGRIDNFLDPLPPQTRLVLINAVFFKGVWASQFKPEDTLAHEFLVPPGKSIGTVDMMKQFGSFNYGRAPSMNATILELPYTNSAVSMFVLLPDQITTDSIIQNLSRETMGEALRSMRPTDVHVGLPKFNMTTKIQPELKQGLQTLGINELFVPGLADLSAFTRDELLTVDEAIHEATVEVNEEGTVAAAATGLIITRFGGPRIDFLCNRPFVFLIHHKRAGVTLFVGRYSSPPQE